MEKDLKKKITQRLKILEGQIRGLQRMTFSEEYCTDILKQSSATKQALSRVEDLILENYLATCVVDNIKSGDIKKSQEEILEVYKLARKNS